MKRHSFPQNLWVILVLITLVGVVNSCGDDDSLPSPSELDFQYIFDYEGMIYGIDKDFNDSVTLSSNRTDLRFEPSNVSFPFSPDFSQAVVLHETPEFSNLVMLNLDGSGVQDLTNSSLRDYQPSWSPDGSKIVFLRREGVAVNNLNNIFIINSEGSEIQNVSTEGYHWTPRFINDQTILYQKFSESHEELKLYTLDLRTLEETIVQGFEGLDVPWYTVSNDNSKIVYYLEKSSSEWELHLTDIDGSQHDLLAVLPKPYGFESWSPDNTELLLVSPRREIGTSLWRLQIGSASENLEDMTPEIEDEALIANGIWSPDGSKVLFLANRSGRSDIYLSTTGGLTNLTETRLEQGIPGRIIKIFWVD